MKKEISIFLATITTSLVLAQEDHASRFEGTVIYEEVVQLDIQLEGDAARFANALPKERKSQKILYFTEEAAIYENHHVDAPEEAMEMEGGGTVMIKIQEPENKTYLDLAQKMMIEQKEFMSRIFLIQSELDPGKWKLTGKQKMVLDYSCQEAISSMGDKIVRAWFAPQIPVPAGPGTFSNLPGLVLAVDVNDGDQIIQALSVDLSPVDKQVMIKPTKGKKVSEEEYRSIVDEKMKEMGTEPGEGGMYHTVVVEIKQ